MDENAERRIEAWDLVLVALPGAFATWAALAEHWTWATMALVVFGAPFLIQAVVTALNDELDDVAGCMQSLPSRLWPVLP